MPALDGSRIDTIVRLR